MDQRFIEVEEERLPIVLSLRQEDGLALALNGCFDSFA